jgi:FAD/FMN-containing dehydrogenase
MTGVTAVIPGFTGQVITAGDDRYDELRSIWNAMHDRRPAMIARCENAADVVDLRPMNKVTVDPAARTATVRGGVLLGEVDRAAQEHGLVVPGGSCAPGRTGTPTCSGRSAAAGTSAW